MNTRKFLLILSVLMLTALACSLPFVGGQDNGAPADGGGGSGSEDGGTSASGQGDAGDPGEPGDTISSDGGEGGSPGEPSGESGGPGSSPGQPLNLDDPSIYDAPIDANTYKTSFEFTFNSDDTVTGTVQMTGANQVEPYATTLQFFTSGNAVFGTGDVFTFTQIGEMQYVVVPEFGCQASSDGIQENPFDATLDEGGMLTGMAEYNGEEFINGVDTYVYEITQENIDPLDPAGTDVRELQNGQIYIAQDGGYIVRLLLEGTGVSEVLSQDPNLEGDVVYDLNFFDFGLPVDISVPNGCAEVGGEDSQFPVPDDATDLTQFSGVMTYKSSMSIADLVAFYEAEMPAYGCSSPQVVGDETSGTSMEFTGCDGGDVQVLIVPESETSNLVSVFSMP